MNKISDKYTNDTFENIKNIDEYGNEYWFARELQKVLEYKDWRNFQKVIDKAVISAKNSVSAEEDWVVEINKPIKTGKGKEEFIKDYKLSRYICYLIVQNADPSKEVVAFGQTYFAIQTRKQEITEQEYDSLSDDEKRFYQRKLTKQGNYTLQRIASSAGVKNMAEFHNAGYKGLYNGETADDIFKRKKLRYREDILDNMNEITLKKEVIKVSNKENKSCASTNINWYPGHMAKAKRQIAEDLKLIDVVIELLDARIPISSQNPDIKELIGTKKKIVVLNKSDLAQEEATKQWVKYFEEKGDMAVIVDANSGKGIKEVVRKIQTIMQEQLEELSEKGRKGRAIRVLVLGIPNVGKSSFINRIANKTSAKVGNRPGITVQKQWIRVTNNIELLDTPGVLWPKFQNQEVGLNLSYTGTIKDEILEKTEIAFYLLKFLLNQYKTNLIQRYKLEEEQIEQIKKEKEEHETIMEIMQLIGRKRGAVVSGGRVDEEKVANIIVEDFRSGKLGRISIEKVKREDR